MKKPPPFRALIAAPLAAGLVFVLLLLAVAVGLRQPAEARLAAVAAEPQLDYSRLSTARIAPLRDDFVEDVLGPGEDPSTVPSVLDGQSPGGGGDPDPGGGSPPPVAHAFTNDDFESAKPITEIPFAGSTRTAGATREPGEPAGCGIGGSVWYTYRSDRAAALVASTDGTSYPTSLGVFTGSALTRLQRVGCSSSATGSSAVTFPAVPGTTYHFRIAGPVGGQLRFSLRLRPTTLMASIGFDDRPGNGFSERPGLSEDGRYVAFQSDATNLDPSRICQVCRRQVYLRDLLTGQTEMVSVTPFGLPAETGGSFGAVVSAHGRYVAFASSASNLVEGDSNEASDVFVRDMVAGVTRRVSVTSSGEETTGLPSHDLVGWAAPGYSDSAAISADGRVVGFRSLAPNLAPDDTNSEWDVFVHDMGTRTTTMVSRATSGEAGNNGANSPSLSENGRYVCFGSSASNMGALTPNPQDPVRPIVGIEVEEAAPHHPYMHDRLSGRTILVDVTPAGAPSNRGGSACSISGDGRFAVFHSESSDLVSGDTNLLRDTFVRDLSLGETLRVSVSSSGRQAENFDKAPVEFVADGLQGDFQPFAFISGNGRFVVFTSDSPNLVDGDTNRQPDIYVHDLVLRTTTRVSLSSDGAQANARNFFCSISGDGAVVAWASEADNLTAGDTNQATDVFLRL